MVGVHTSVVAVTVETVAGGNRMAAMAAWPCALWYAFQPNSAPKNTLSLGLAAGANHKPGR
jgi:hypothetical protein